MQTLDLRIRTQPKDADLLRQAEGQLAKRPPRGAPEGVVDVGGLAADAGADDAELVRGALAQEGDGHDADDGDEGHEQGVLDEAGAPFVTAEPGPDMGGAVLPRIGDVHEAEVPSVRWAVGVQIDALRGTVK